MRITVEWLNDNGFFQDGEDKNCKEFGREISNINGECLQLIYSLLDYSMHLETYDDGGRTLDIIELPKKHPTGEELLGVYNSLKA